MKLSSQSLMMTSLAIAFPMTLASNRYEPKGTILGTFGTTETSNPRVVLSYLSSCAQVPWAGDDLKTCLISTFINLQYPGKYITTAACSAPTVEYNKILEDTDAATAACVDSGGNFRPQDVDDLLQNFLTILSDQSCWDSLCEEGIHEYLEADWMMACAGVRLPYPLPSEDELFLQSTESLRRSSLLTCMLDYVMNEDPTTFGLDDYPEGSPRQCFPPGFENVEATCPAIAAKAFDRCSNKTVDEEIPKMEMSFSYSYDGDEDDDAAIRDEFCAILEKLSRPDSRECLLSLCEFEMTPSPTQSSAPSLSALPSSSPPGPPTAPPTLQPPSTASPTTESPTTAPPTSNPTTAPPTGNPTTAELQGLAGVNVSAVITLNITFAAVPLEPSALDTFVSVLTRAVQSTVDDLDGDSNVDVISVGGLSIGRNRRDLRQERLLRRLEEEEDIDDADGNFLDVDLQLDASRECYESDCHEVAMRAAVDYATAFSMAAEDGSLTTALQSEAAADGTAVSALENASVVANEIQASSTFVVVVDRDRDDEDDEDEDEDGDDNDGEGGDEEDDGSGDDEDNGDPDIPTSDAAAARSWTGLVSTLVCAAVPAFLHIASGL